MQLIARYKALNTTLTKLRVITAGGVQPYVRITTKGARVVFDAHNESVSAAVELPGGGGVANGTAIVDLPALCDAISKLKPRVAKAELEVGLGVTEAGLVVIIDGREKTVPLADAGLKLPARPAATKADAEVVKLPVGTFAPMVWQVTVAADFDDAPPVYKHVHFHRDSGAVLVAMAADGKQVHQGLLGEPAETAVDLSLRATDVERAIKLIGLPGGTPGLVEEAEQLTMYARGGNKAAVWKVANVTVGFRAWTDPKVTYPYTKLTKLLESAVSTKRTAVTLATVDANDLFDLAESKAGKREAAVWVAIDARSGKLGVATEEGAKEKWAEAIDVAKTDLTGTYEFRIRPYLMADALAGIIGNEATLSLAGPTDGMLVHGDDFTALVQPLKPPANPAKAEPKAIAATPAEATPEPAKEEAPKPKAPATRRARTTKPKVKPAEAPAAEEAPKVEATPEPAETPAAEEPTQAEPAEVAEKAEVAA